MRANRLSRLICVDAESNGLVGQILAIGAVVLDLTKDDQVIDSFRCRAPWPGDDQLEPWVRNNIPPLSGGEWDEPLARAPYQGEMIVRFWRWYRWWMQGPESFAWKDDPVIAGRASFEGMRDAERTIVIADHQFPVESNLFSAAIAQDPEKRAFLGPNPLHELGTLRLVRQQAIAYRGGPIYVSPRRSGHRDHDPYDDAWSSGKEAADHLRLLGILPPRGSTWG